MGTAGTSVAFSNRIRSVGVEPPSSTAAHQRDPRGKAICDLALRR